MTPIERTLYMAKMLSYAEEAQKLYDNSRKYDTRKFLNETYGIETKGMSDKEIGELLGVNPIISEDLEIKITRKV